ncbi:hypothetical protein [uncultured Duncaniella sp.]|uniref:hypothetical protein n=1 Tax=uncultured Duncaniella sp. TaxID=2768039 RepID=UPI0025A9EF9C|nr:hypothetical protein [uncultured Duncaniella sp.]
MKKILSLMLLFSIASFPFLNAANEPLPPPIEKRRIVWIEYIDPYFDYRCEWSYPAEGYFTWVLSTGLTNSSFFVILKCLNPVDNGHSESHLVAVTGLSYYLVMVGDWSHAWVDEYNNFDKMISKWHFSASLNHNYDTTHEVAFVCFDDIPIEKDPGITV